MQTVNPLACALTKWSGQEDRCEWCDAQNVHGGRWCSSWHEHLWFANHRWSTAREYALRRDGRRCVKCGGEDRVEVHHITPLRGIRPKTSCWHHLHNLTSLCHDCHDEITFIQNKIWSE